MGEVYRADDLKLGQAVALKFLPAHLEVQSDRLQRFFAEVRLSRQVTHPNVCRIYDVGEVDGQHFISMEFVDGEDLASLERRIGRLPETKALEVARQLCAGLAAAHNQGILHRDLKPSNIMLDGRGRVRITDFGLAALADRVPGAEIQSGTPAYMAPEQIRGENVSVRSDIYSLGLVLYELFTGRPARRADNFADLLRQHDTPPPAPTSIVRDVNPAVARIIMQCLAVNPQDRPESALVVAAALPGGNLLAEALAAGETPSPEMVAASRGSSGLRPWVVMLCLAGLALGGVAQALLQQKLDLIHQLDVPEQPQVLEAASLELLGVVGQSPSVYRAYGFEWDPAFLDYAKSVGGEGNFSSIRPSPLQYWFRQSPAPLVPTNYAGWVGPEDPPATTPGMVSVRLDSNGRLLSLLVIPPHVDVPAGSQSPPARWRRLFQRAGLDFESLKPTDPTLNAPIDCDERLAWLGHYPDQPDIEIRVEAGMYRGKPYFFEVIPPWRTKESSTADPGPSALVWALYLGVLSILAIAALTLMRRNLRQGRGDRKGASRTAAAVFLLSFAIWLLQADHVLARSELPMLHWALAQALFLGVLVWILYIALEPYIRKFWPDTLVSWSRVITGKLGDPLVGRDFVFGALFGMGLSLLVAFSRYLAMEVGPNRLPPMITGIDSLVGLRAGLGRMLSLLNEAVVLPLGLTLLIVVLRIFIRKHWTAVGMAFAAFVGLAAVGQESWVMVAMLPLFWLVVFIVLIRFGLLSVLVLFYYSNLPFLFPVNTDLTVWYNGQSLLLLALAVLAVLGAAYFSLGDRPLFKDEILES